MSIEALTLIKTLIARHDIACDWASGQMQVAVKPRHETELCTELELMQQQYDYRSVRYMPRAELRSVLATDRYIGALFDSNSGHLHPLNYTLGLASAAERAGARLFEETRALDFQTTPGGASVRTAGGALNCRQLVLCGNAYLGRTAPELQRTIISVGTSIVATEPMDAPAATRLIANNAAVVDTNWILDYFRLTPDHRLLFGGRVSYRGDTLRTRAATRARMLRVFPQLRSARIEHGWSGALDITRHRAPHFGRLAPNVYFLQGFSGHGIALAGFAGKVVAEAIAGTSERFDVFARIPQRPFPGGAALRRPALMLAMLYYRLRDLL
jgi:gamma-glutamylputrescine oxidase